MSSKEAIMKIHPEPQPTKRVLVTGASGLIGRRLVELCRADDAYGAVHILTRRPLSLGAAGGVGLSGHPDKGVASPGPSAAGSPAGRGCGRCR